MSARTSEATDLEGRIDELYQRPLSEFTPARNALAKSLTGPDADRVKRLTKPALVPWIVNQVYWRARSVYERLLLTGAALRSSQIAAIEKPGTTERAAEKQRQQRQQATAAHQKAIADAVHQGVRLAAEAAVRPPIDALTRMFEALSLAPDPPGPPGRLTTVIEPTGFGVFAGVVAAPLEPVPRDTGARERSSPRTTPAASPPAPTSGRSSASSVATEQPARNRERAREDKAARLERKRIATRALDEARRNEARLRSSLAEAEQARKDAERALARVVDVVTRAKAELEAAAVAREAAERALAEIE